MAKFYNVAGNNNVTAIMSEKAFEAALKRKDVIEGTELWSELTGIVARGTFTVVASQDDFERYYKELGVTGTWRDMELWLQAGGHELVSSCSLSFWVPFSNGPDQNEEIYRRSPGDVIEAFGLAGVPAAR